MPATRPDCYSHSEPALQAARGWGSPLVKGGGQWVLFSPGYPDCPELCSPPPNTVLKSAELFLLFLEFTKKIDTPGE